MEIDKDILKRPLNEYINTLSPVKEYINQAKTFLSKRTNLEPEEAEKYVIEEIQNKKKNHIRNPIVEYRHRLPNGDIKIEKCKLTEYLQNTIDNKEIIVPSFTTYYHPDKRKSIHADFLFNNVSRRSKYKKEAFKNKQEGDLDKARHNDNMQKTMKIFNNSVSGAYASKSTILYNPSAHYTLTSITRCVSSIGNAVSESFLAGNKYFKSADIVYNYILSIISNASKTTIEYVIRKYHLHIPTVDQIIDMIKESASPYWNNDYVYYDLKRFLSKLEPYELVAIMYTNDFWNLKKYNDTLVRNLITNVSKKVSDLTDDPRYLTQAPDGVETLAKIICADDIKGMNLNYQELRGQPILFKLASTAKHIIEQLSYYKMLFKAFYLTDILPIDIANIKQMMRDVIVLSDTDSTCGTYAAWVEWYYGKPMFNNEGISVAAVVMTLAGAFIDHGLKVLSKNMNISKDRIELLKMKNEFYWSVFTITNANKHYYAQTMIQEGNIYKHPELELKGVHLIGSAADQSVIKKTHNMIEDIISTIAKGNKIDIAKYVNIVRDMEKEILERINSGDISIFKKDKIKEEKSYKLNIEVSPYIHHILWESVFAEKYGHAPKPTYMVIKIPTILNSKKKLAAYIQQIEDEDIKTKFNSFIEKYDKDQLGTIRPPVSIVSNQGIPTEILNIIDKERIIKDNLNAAYLVLESIGVYRKVDRLLLDMGY